MDTPFEIWVQPWVTRLESVADAKGFVRDYVRRSRAEPFGGYGARYGADLDVEGLAEALRQSRGAGLPGDAASTRFLLDGLSELVREGVMRAGPLDLRDAFRASGFSVTVAGEAWLTGGGSGDLV